MHKNEGLPEEIFNKALEMERVFKDKVWSNHITPEKEASWNGWFLRVGITEENERCGQEEGPPHEFEGLKVSTRWR